MVDYDRFAHLYDAEFASFHDDLAILRFYAERADGPLLELGCGTGRCLLPLARAGFQLSGVDSSPAMLARAARALREAGLSAQVTLIEGDMVNADLARTFGMAFVPINTFMHLESLARQRGALRHWHRYLRPGATLILDLFNPDLLTLVEADGRLMFDQRWVDPQSGAAVIKQYTRRIDLATQTQDTLFVYDELFADGQSRRTVVPFTMRFLWRAEAELLLELCGYRTETVYGSYDMDDYTAESPRLIVIARRL